MVGRWLGDGVPQANALVELSAAAVTAASTTIVALIGIKPSLSPFHSGPRDARRPDSISAVAEPPIPARVLRAVQVGVTRPGHCETREARRLTPPRQWLHQLAPRRAGTPPLDIWTLLQASVPGNSSGKDPPGSRRSRPGAFQRIEIGSSSPFRGCGESAIQSYGRRAGCPSPAGLQTADHSTAQDGGDQAGGAVPCPHNRRSLKTLIQRGHKPASADRSPSQPTATG
jgi:hypothetical protein